VEAPPGFSIQFIFSADKHQERTVTYTVTTSRTQGYAMIYTPLVKFVFARYDNGAALQGVVATINGQSYVSDADGKIYVRDAGTLTGAATHDYGRADISTAVSGYDDLTVDVVLIPYVSVKLRVIVGGGINLPVKGAA
jgi:hypothetical protein